MKYKKLFWNCVALAVPVPAMGIGYVIGGWMAGFPVAAIVGGFLMVAVAVIWMWAIYGVVSDLDVKGDRE